MMLTNCQCAMTKSRPLKELQEIDWDQFMPVIQQALAKEHKGPGGRPRYDAKMMLIILVIKRMYDFFAQYCYKERPKFVNPHFARMRSSGVRSRLAEHF